MLKILFGKGTQSGGLIDANGLLLGGLGDKGVASGLGARLDAKSLGAIVGISEEKAAPWVEVLNRVLASGDINTAQRLSMFLANAAQETQQLAKLSESWNSPEENYFENEKKYGYQYDKGNALGNKVFGDGAKYRGRGLLHITGRYNYEIATFGYAADKPGNVYTSYTDWKNTSQEQELTSVKNEDGTVTVSGRILPGWSVRVAFPKQSQTVNAEFKDYVDSVNAGTFSIKSDGKRATGQVKVLAMKTNFVENAAQISSDKELAAQLGVW